MPGRGYGKSKQINTFIMSKFNKLSRAEMKNVLGGVAYNPNCGDSNPTDDWTCCRATSSVYIGETDCQTASSSCDGFMITNDPERCN